MGAVYLESHSLHKLEQGDANRPTRVVHCVLSLGVGGLERIVVDLVRMARRRGEIVSVLCLEQPGVLAAQVEASGADVYCLNKPPGIDAETSLKAEEFLARTKPDLLHTHQIGALWYAGRAARRAGVPAVIHTEHIDNAAKTKGLWKKLKLRTLWRRSAKYADYFCCVSRDIARSAARWWTVPKRKIRVVLNGIDTDRYNDHPSSAMLRQKLGIANDVKVIGNVGRLNEVKRQDLLLRAFARLREQVANLHLLLVGDGPEKERLKDLASTLGISSAVTFAGYQLQPESYLQVMDVFALTSRLEGLPLVILEAWAAGLPVVSTSVGGVPGLIDDNENGLLIPDGDETALVAALKALLNDPKLASMIAARGRSLARERYSLSRMDANYCALRDGVLEQLKVLAKS
jgi:sugar transferase (PEP-CTERM/EpsH1 system associated)